MHYDRSVFRALAMVSQLGLSVMAPIFLCVFIGCLADERFGTRLLLPLLVLGVLAGGRNAYRLTGQLLKQQEREAAQARGRQRAVRRVTGTVKPKTASRIRVCAAEAVPARAAAGAARTGEASQKGRGSAAGTDRPPAAGTKEAGADGTQ